MKKLGTLLVLMAAGMFIVGTTGCGDKTDSKTKTKTKTEPTKTKTKTKTE